LFIYTLEILYIYFIYALFCIKLLQFYFIYALFMLEFGYFITKRRLAYNWKFPKISDFSLEYRIEVGKNNNNGGCPPSLRSVVA